jgi:dihydroorotate dehydrogenase (NAD+) catalytic subunit
VKLTPNVADIAEVALAVEAAGADAISAVNTFVGMSIDLRTLQPRLANRSGGLSGPAIRPAALHLAHQAAGAVKIPVVGIGGITCAEDALEFLVAGCAAVQVGSATFVNPRAIAEVHDGIGRFLLGRGLASLQELPRWTAGQDRAGSRRAVAYTATRT